MPIKRLPPIIKRLPPILLRIRVNGPRPWVAAVDSTKDEETGWWGRRFLNSGYTAGGILTIAIPDKDAVYDICFGEKGYRKYIRVTGSESSLDEVTTYDTVSAPDRTPRDYKYTPLDVPVEPPLKSRFAPDRYPDCAFEDDRPIYIPKEDSFYMNVEDINLDDIEDGTPTPRSGKRAPQDMSITHAELTRIVRSHR